MIGQKEDNPILTELLSQQERCWKAVLSPAEESECPGGKDEWSIVRDHFANSRSKKVLTIIQQK